MTEQFNLHQHFKDLQIEHGWDGEIAGGFNHVVMKTANLNHLNEMKTLAFLMGMEVHEKEHPTENAWYVCGYEPKFLASMERAYTQGGHKDPVGLPALD